MLYILFVGIILTIISFLRREQYSPYLGFFFVFLIMGLQSGVAGDFDGYKEIFENIKRTGVLDARTIEDEPFFPYLMQLFPIDDFHLFVVFISFIQYIILSRFVKTYAPSKQQYLSAILFFFTYPFMLLQMKAFRQGLVVEIMLIPFFLLDKLNKKNMLLVVFTTLVAYLIHNTALLIVPFLIVYGWNQLKKENNLNYNNNIRFWLPVILTTLYLVVYTAKIRILNQYLVSFALFSEERFSNYLSEDVELAFELSPLIILYDAVIVFLVSWYYQFASPKMKCFAVMSIIAAFGDMLLFGLGSLPRMLMYYSIINIVVYPQVAQQIKKTYGKFWMLIFVVFLIGYAIKTSLPSIVEMVDDTKFGHYHFFFM